MGKLDKKDIKIEVSKEQWMRAGGLGNRYCFRKMVGKSWKYYILRRA